MFTTTALRRLVPVAALVAVGATAFALSGSGDADAADGTTYYGGASASQPAFFFFDAHDTAGAANNAESDPGNDPEYNSSDVCDNNPQLEARMGTKDSDEQEYTCAFLINDCPLPAAGMLLGITVAPGDDPSKVTDDSTCWSYPANVPIERTAPYVALPPVNAQDPVFEVTTGSTAAEPEWDLDIAAPNGPKSGTKIRASHETVDGSIALHSLGVTAGSGAETAAGAFSYLDKDGTPRWAEIATNDRWITVSIADGLKMDPQVCLDSGICQETSTLQYVGADGGRDSATILSHM